ncbi:active breakpoint cluster region-related protein isoform X2 [Boleophthalmus pectinirostris]|uniref:active breakpoint cluster region-related protein isoform X2 n=1 Tax=Boleophthalmus pectinirostris TaxID=150288 RepID=UPI00242CB441|nr:active breakpoint cluster region-related protein isoform X2 [Boleophthalmus pectinirostris]
MDVFQEAVDYLEARHVPIVMEAEPEVLEEDVFHEEGAPLFSPLVTTMTLPDTPPMKALRASAGTSQPVLSAQQVQTVFYQVPELKQLHHDFYCGLKARLTAHCDQEQEQEPAPDLKYSSDPETETKHKGFELTVGDLFLKLVNQIGLYGGYIENYVDAVNVVQKCTQADPRFKTLAESMMSNNNGSPKSRTKYTFEALLYKPLDRVTKTTLVLRDLLKTTPEEHQDHPSLQEALRLSQSFLSGVNESSQSRRGVTLTHEKRRQLIRDGFLVDESDGELCLRHLFLYTDLLLCTRVKPATRGKQDQYRFAWYLPLAGLRLRCFSHERTPEAQLRLHTIRTKMYQLHKQLQQHVKGYRVRSWKKPEQTELLLLTLSPVYRLELHSPNGKSHTLLSSLYELEKWKEAICKLTKENIEPVPPDLLTLTSACLKLRMTQTPPLHSSSSSFAQKMEGLCGTLAVVIHSASGLQQPACVSVCVEVDGFDFYEKQAQTHSVHALNPQWEQELYFQVDGARHMRVICVRQLDGQDWAVLGKTSITLDPKSLSNRWRKQSLNLGEVDVNLSLKYTNHPPDPPSPSSQQQQPVFGVPIETVAQQEGVLVPHVIRCCVEEVERRGMDEVGIYRVSGTTGDINTLKTAFNCNLCEAVTRLRGAEVNAVCGVLKLYFRELPEPLIPAELFQSLAQALDLTDTDARSSSLLSAMKSCPDTNRNTLLFLLHHLRRVSERQDVNKMSLLNLATVFGPSLLRPPVTGDGSDGAGIDISQEVVVQVQVVYWYLQCNDLPQPQISLPHDTDTEDETTHL